MRINLANQLPAINRLVLTVSGEVINCVIVIPAATAGDSAWWLTGVHPNHPTMKLTNAQIAPEGGEHEFFCTFCSLLLSH